MLATVQLHDQLPLAAAEIYDVWPDGNLARELRSVQPAIP
jgi:hypothetical protein